MLNTKTLKYSKEDKQHYWQSILLWMSFFVISDLLACLKGRDFLLAHFISVVCAAANFVECFIHGNRETQSQVIKGLCKKINLTRVRPTAKYFSRVNCSQLIHHLCQTYRQRMKGCVVMTVCDSLDEKLSFNNHYALHTKPPVWVIAYTWQFGPKYSSRSHGKIWTVWEFKSKYCK